MNDIRQKDVETYVRDLIFKKIKNLPDAAKSRYHTREEDSCINSTPESGIRSKIQKNGSISTVPNGKVS